MKRTSISKLWIAIGVAVLIGTLLWINIKIGLIVFGLWLITSGVLYLNKRDDETN